METNARTVEHRTDGDRPALSPEARYLLSRLRRWHIVGFGRRTLTSFGEAATKALVETTLEEVKKLEMALRKLSTPVRVVLLHYAPVEDTIVGEPEQIYAFLGTDRLAEPLDRYEAAVAFHGHAHHGSFRGRTPGGVPVFNVSLQQIRQEGVGELYFIYEIPLPERRGDGEDAEGEMEMEAAATPSAPGSASAPPPPGSRWAARRAHRHPAAPAASAARWSSP